MADNSHTPSGPAPAIPRLIRRMGFHAHRDRLGRHFGFASRWLGIALVFGKWGWAGSLHIARKRIWLRPINYAVANQEQA